MDRPSLDARLARAQLAALVVGVVGAALCGVGLMGDEATVGQVYRSYLVGYLYWLGMGLGCLSILLVQHLSGGRWGQFIRRFLEAGAGTLPLLAILFLPIVLGVHHIYYAWTGDAVPHSAAAEGETHAAQPLPGEGPALAALESHTDAAAGPAAHGHDAILAKKAAYLTLDFNPYSGWGFYGRAVIYFVIWTLLALALNRWSLSHDRDGRHYLFRRLQAVSGVGLVLYALAMTFASVDWGMSLEPHWFSTMYGVLFMVGQAVGAMALVIVLCTQLRDEPPLASLTTIDRLHDLGNLLMAFVMLWAYISFSQYLIIWSGNIPEETPWYVSRTLTSWKYTALLLSLFHFAVPFLLLVSRVTKRTPGMLAAVAGGLLAMRLVDLFWLIKPAFSPGGFSLHWLDLVTPVAVGGLWLAMFFWLLRRRISVPVLVEHH